MRGRLQRGWNNDGIGRSGMKKNNNEKNNSSNNNSDNGNNGTMDKRFKMWSPSEALPRNGRWGVMCSSATTRPWSRIFEGNSLVCDQHHSL